MQGSLAGVIFLRWRILEVQGNLQKSRLFLRSHMNWIALCLKLLLITRDTRVIVMKIFCVYVQKEMEVGAYVEFMR